MSETARQLSENCGKLSEMRQDKVKKVSEHFQKTVREVSENDQKTVRQLSENYNQNMSARTSRTEGLLKGYRAL